ncbi:MAG: glycosyltransferase [Candidatus Aenigmarchaeota archaeon]|nr:glycosyltransferase [Candidatus Aenigmarchaeota archaeon]
MIFLLPTLNEEKGLQEVLPKIKKHFPGLKILIVDGGSKDRTMEIAKKFGCEFFVQSGKGKGNGMIEAVERIDENETVAMLDSDGSYEPLDIKKMLKMLESNSIVMGNRLSEGNEKAFTTLNRIGNKMINLTASILFFKRIHDMLTGIRVFKCKTFKKLNLKAQNFEIETEMTLRSIRKGVKIIETPCRYYERKGETKLNPLKDGFRISRRMWLERVGWYG